MKLLLLVLFAAATAAAPLDASGDPVELIVNGVPEGHALELGEIVDITVKEHAEGEVVAQSNLLHPLTAVGIAEAAAAAAAAAQEAATQDVPETIEANPETPAIVDANPEAPAIVDANPEAPAIVDANPEAPAIVDANPEAPAIVEVNPETPAIVEANPETPVMVDISPITPIENPAIVDGPEVIPVNPVSPVEVVEVETLPDAAAQVQYPSGEVYNDGMVQVQVNYPEEGGLMGTLKSWISVAFNYFQNGIPTTQQIL